MKLVILDGYTENPGDLSWEGLEKLGELTVYDRIPYDTEAVVGHIGDAEAVYVNKVPLTREVMDACPSLRFIGVLATGYNVVDTEAAKEKGITVEDVAEEITYRKETNAFSNNPKNEAFMNMTLNELVRIKEMWNI